MTKFLTGELTAGTWRIILGGPLDNLPCVDTNNSPSACEMFETGTDLTISADIFDGLSVDGPSSSSDSDIVLNGSTTAGRDTQLTDVETSLRRLHSDIAPDDCTQPGGNTPIIMTSTNGLSENINVIAGQATQATATLTVPP